MIRSPEEADEKKRIDEDSIGCRVNDATLRKRGSDGVVTAIDPPSLQRNSHV
jgi:hypothetical protein